MTDSIRSRGLTRRQMLKATAATTAVAAVGDKLFGGPMSSLVESVSAAPVTEDVWIPSVCHLCNACDYIVAHRVDGVVVKIEGNPKASQNKGKMCARGNAGIQKIYNPFRIKSPVKRTNPEKGRGVDPKWVEISWDEALDTVAAKLKAVREKDPRGLVYMEGHAKASLLSRKDIGEVFGTPNWMSGSGGMTCYAGLHNIGYFANGTSSTFGVDTEYCNYFLNVGACYGLNKADPEAIRDFVHAKERGMKVVVVDPRLDRDSTKADEWVPIRPGTDLAFLLSLANVMLYELKKFDADFIKKRTNGPYLIRSDNGLYMRSSTAMLEKDVLRKDQALGKPYVWDSVDNKAKVFDDPTIKDFALEGTFTVEGAACRPGFDLLKAGVKDYSPEWAEKISSVPATTIRRIASELVEAARFGSTIVVDGVTFPYRPVSVLVGKGGQTHRWGTAAVLAGLQLDYLLGTYETPGGCVIGSAKQAAGVDGLNLVKHTKGRKGYYPPTTPVDYSMWWSYWPFSYKNYWATHDAFLNPKKYGIDYELEMFLFSGCGPVIAFGSPDVITAGFKKIPFIASISYHFDEMTELSDIVFPEGGFTERLMEEGDGIRQPLVAKPVYNTRLPEDIITQLAARSGLLSAWNKSLNDKVLALKDPYKLDLKVVYTQEEMIDRSLKSQHGAEFGLEWFKKNGLKEPAPAPARETYGFYHNPKTRYPLYHEYFQWAAAELKKDLAAAKLTHPYPGWAAFYEALPSWHPNPTLEAPAEYDLFESNFRPATMSMGRGVDLPWVREVMDKFDRYPMSVWINKDTAAKKGLKDGDLVWVDSYVREPWSKVQGEVLTSEGVHPEACIIGGQWGRWAVGMNPIAKDGANHNSLLSIKLDYCDHFSGNVEYGSKVKIYKV